MATAAACAMGVLWTGDGIENVWRALVVLQVVRETPLRDCRVHLTLPLIEDGVLSGFFSDVAFASNVSCCMPSVRVQPSAVPFACAVDVVAPVGTSALFALDLSSMYCGRCSVRLVKYVYSVRGSMYGGEVCTVDGVPYGGECTVERVDGVRAVDGISMSSGVDTEKASVTEVSSVSFRRMSITATYVCRSIWTRVA
eukprot:1547920-Rhodomonas_salina.5